MGCLLVKVVMTRRFRVGLEKRARLRLAAKRESWYITRCVRAQGGQAAAGSLFCYLKSQIRVPVTP
jgi:hypothetical protein